MNLKIGPVVYSIFYSFSNEGTELIVKLLADVSVCVHLRVTFTDTVT